MLMKGVMHLKFNHRFTSRLKVRENIILGTLDPPDAEECESNDKGDLPPTESLD